MGWIEFESLWLFCPFFDDEFVRGKAFEQREAIALIICVDEIGEMSFELLMPIVMVVFDGGFLDRPVHSLHLAICPRMLELGQTMHNAIFLASHVEQVRHVGGCRPIRVARREGELDAIVRQDGLDSIGKGRIKASRKADADVRLVFFTNCTKANLLVRSMAT
jgi:hypothetical protein